MWPFTKKPETVSIETHQQISERWIDLDARVTRLEMLDREYKVAKRRTFSSSEKTEDINSNEGGLLKRGIQKSIP